MAVGSRIKLGAKAISAARDIRRNLSRLGGDLEGRDFDKMVRSVMRQHHPEIRSILKRRIRNKGLIHSGLMLRVGVRTLVPRRQQPNRPWVVTYVNRRFGFQSGFLEDGTVDRHTKKGYYRGKISQSKHKSLMKQSLRIADRVVKPKMAAAVQAKVDSIINKHGF